MAHSSLDPENPPNPCRSGGSNLHVHCEDPRETGQAIRVGISKSHQVSEGCSFLEAMGRYHSVVTMVELVGVPRPNGGAGQGRRPKKGAEFLLHVLHSAESNAGLEG